MSRCGHTPIGDDNARANPVKPGLHREDRHVMPMDIEMIAIARLARTRQKDEDDAIHLHAHHKVGQHVGAEDTDDSTDLARRHQLDVAWQPPRNAGHAHGGSEPPQRTE